MQRNELTFEDYIIERLEENLNNISTVYDENTGFDTDMLYQFLVSTQKQTIDRLLDFYSKEQLLVEICYELDKKGTLFCLQNGVSIRPDGGKEEQLIIFFTKPNNNLNPDDMLNFAKNKFFVAKELYHTGDERIDLSIGVNGIHLFAVELKNGTTQTYLDAEKQLKEERTHSTKYFKHLLCSFAMDRFDISMCAQLSKTAQFLPFNQGTPDGGSGNDLNKLYPTDYFYTEIMTKDSITNLIQNFIIEEGNKKIFPRYHQFECTNKIMQDIENQYYIDGEFTDFLIAAAAGSGKSFMIAWTAYRLAYINDAETSKPIFDTVIVLSNRKVINSQLQNTLKRINHQEGVISTPDTSYDLMKAINNRKKIIICNIQKFPFVVDGIQQTNGSKFAVLIDEGHDSSTGEYMAAVKESMNVKTEQSNNSNNANVTDIDSIIENLRKNRHEGKLDNAVFLAFTATPKKETLQIFGRTSGRIAGQYTEYVPFYSYSMKQAIEEGYILDVLQNYTTYNTYCRVKSICESESIMVEVANAKRAIGQAISQDDNVISEKVRIFMDFYRPKAGQLDGNSKAMIVTGSRVEALKYLRFIEEYIKYHNLPYEALVAYSGVLEEDGIAKTEKDINAHILGDTKLEAYFHENPKCKFLIVADKYTTGFDEEYLNVMLVDDVLKGTKCVQTISRLNRLCPGKVKNTYVLDFKNDYESICDAFSVYYTDVKLYSKDNTSDIYELEARVDELNLIDYETIKEASHYLQATKFIKKDEFYARLSTIIKVTRDKIEEMVLSVGDDLHDQNEERKRILWVIRRFLRLFDFKSQIEVINDERLFDKKVFYSYLVQCIKAQVNNVELKMIQELIRIHNVEIQVHQNYQVPELQEGMVLKTSITERSNQMKEPEIKSLKEIIAEINEQIGLSSEATLIQDLIDFSLANEFHNKALESSRNFNEYFTIICNGIPQVYNAYKVIASSSYFKELKLTGKHKQWQELILKPALRIIWENKN